MSKSYNYDTRGASSANQIVNLERMVEIRDAEIERLRNLHREEAHHNLSLRIKHMAIRALLLDMRQHQGSIQPYIKRIDTILQDNT